MSGCDFARAWDESESVHLRRFEDTFSLSATHIWSSNLSSTDLAYLEKLCDGFTM